MKIAKQVRRQIRHRHFFSLRPFDQPASRRVLKRDLEIMLPAELFGEDIDLLIERDHFMFVTFRQQAIQNAFRFVH